MENRVMLAKKQFRQKLIKRATESERKVFYWLKSHGVKFVFQHVRFGFIYDFYLPEHNLLIEVDGTWHDREDQKSTDATKDRLAKERGFNMVRFRNEAVRDHFKSCMASLGVKPAYMKYNEFVIQNKKKKKTQTPKKWSNWGRSKTSLCGLRCE